MSINDDNAPFEVANKKLPTSKSSGLKTASSAVKRRGAKSGSVVGNYASQGSTNLRSGNTKAQPSINQSSLVNKYEPKAGRRDAGSKFIKNAKGSGTFG